MQVELAARFVFLRPVQRPFSLRRAMLQALHYSRTGFLLPPCPLANRPKVDDLAHAPPNFAVVQACALFLKCADSKAIRLTYWNSDRSLLNCLPRITVHC